MWQFICGNWKAMHLKMAYIWCCTFISVRQDGPSNSWSLRVRCLSFFSSTAIELNVPRVEMSIFISEKTRLSWEFENFKTKRRQKVWKQKQHMTLVGLEPRTLHLEVQWTTHWASNSDGNNLQIWIYLTHTLIYHIWHIHWFTYSAYNL